MLGYELGRHSGPCFPDLPCDRHAAIDEWLRQRLGSIEYSAFRKFLIDLEKDDVPDKEFLAKPVSELEVPAQVWHKLMEYGMNTTGDVWNKGERHLRTNVPGFGRIYTEMVKQAFDLLGYTLPH